MFVNVRNTTWTGEMSISIYFFTFVNKLKDTARVAEEEKYEISPEKRNFSIFFLLVFFFSFSYT